MEVAETLYRLRTASLDVRLLRVQRPPTFGNYSVFEKLLGMFCVRRRIVTHPRSELMTCVGRGFGSRARLVTCMVARLLLGTEVLACPVRLLQTSMEETTVFQAEDALLSVTRQMGEGQMLVE